MSKLVNVIYNHEIFSSVIIQLLYLKHLSCKKNNYILEIISFHNSYAVTIDCANLNNNILHIFLLI